MRGRKRKPLEPRVVDGSYRADRHGPLESAVRPGGEPAPTRKLDGAAKRFWDDVVPQLVALNVATALDSEALTLAAEWHARYVALTVEYEAASKKKLADILDRRRLLVMAAAASDRVDKILARFGFTAADRARLQVDSGTKRSGIARRKRG